MTLAGRQFVADYDYAGIVFLVGKKMARVAIAAFCSVEQEAAGKRIGAIADVDRIVFAAAEIKRFWALAQGRKQRVEIGNAAVVQIRWRSPDAIQWPHFVLQARAYAVLSVAVHLISRGFRNLMSVIPTLNRELHELTQR